MTTLAQVAVVAGVSTSTASRAFAAPERVALATRLRVVAAAESLGYRPNAAASALRRGRRSALGLVVPDLANPYFAEFAKGAQSRARELGQALLIADSDEREPVEEALAAELLERTDGIVLCSPRAPAPNGGTIVLVNAEAGGRPSIVSDDRAAASRVLAHLAALGHRAVVYVGGPAGAWSDTSRRAALAASAAAAGVALHELGAHAPRADGGFAAADEALATGATAVVGYNDLVALGLLARFRARGVRVPEDVSVVGWDDTAMAALATPTLSSVRVDLRAIGAAAVEVLDAEVRGAGGEGRRIVPAELVVRESTGPAPR